MERKVSHWILLLIVLTMSGQAYAGLYERISSDDWGYWPRENEEPPVVEPEPESDNADTPATQENAEAPAAQAEDGALQASDSWVKPQQDQALPSFLFTKDRKAKYVSEMFDPILLVRNSFVYSFIDHQTVDIEGTPTELNTKVADKSQWGHRRGYVLENVEFGAKGRFNQFGLYYTTKFDLVPREKDGNPSTDYLKDAYVGWDQFSFMDLRIGRMKIPFSQANMTSTEKRNTAYAPILNVLIPKRQLGASLEFSDPWKAARLRGGIYNSVASATQQLKDTDELLYSFRVDYSIGNTLKAIDERHSVSGIKDFFETIKRFDVNLAFNYAHVDRYYDTGGEHRWYGLDGKLQLYIFTVLGEYVVKDWKTDPNATEDGSYDAMRGSGFHVDVIADVWPEIISLFLRYENMDGDDGFENGFNKDFPTGELVMQKKTWITTGMNFHVAEMVRMDFEYIMRQEDEGFDVKNDVLMGMVQLAL